MVPLWVLRVGCYFGLITCTTPPGVWPGRFPTVIAPVPPSRTSASSSTRVTSTALPGVTSSAHSFTTSFIETSSVDTSFSSTLVSTPSTFATSSASSSLVSTSSASTFVSASSSSVASSGTSVSSGTRVPSSIPVSSSTVVSSSTPVSPSRTMSLTSSSAIPSFTPSASPIAQGTVAGNILVIAKDSTAAGVASSGLNAYGIPFTTLLVPQAGAALPDLNTTSGGNFGGIVVSGQVSYDYGGSQGYQSALTTDQWNQLYAYQLDFGVRMVQYDVFPGPAFGASAVGEGCCASGVEQLISFSNVDDFPTAGLRTGAGVSTQGLWHYPATISNTTTTKEIAKFAANSVTSGESTAAVINNFGGREQMAFFISFDTVWSATSNYLQHAWINWMTRGLFVGHRRIYLNTQIDDVFLETGIYKPSGVNFRVSTADMDGIANWLPTINAKMNEGSDYWVELGHNGNGNIEEATKKTNGESLCNGGGIEYDSPPDTEMEFKKPLGTGTDLWPSNQNSYSWTTECTQLDDLLIWMTNTANRDKFGHLSHTFTHLEQNNATYSDVSKEISYNQAWLEQNSFTSAKYWTSNGIIPPAITGLHNGDALRAWWDNGITNCVGDNTRSPLLNKVNDMWPYFTTVDSDGFDGMQVNPRWATRIYYNCDTPDCTVQEWIDTSAGSGDFNDLLATEKADTMRHLFGLHHDPYMFHQANLRNADATPITVNGVTAQWSIFQAWVETQVQEFVRLVKWPIVTITHQEMSANFLARYTRDACNYSLRYTIANNQITGATVSSDSNTCSVPIPVTFPVAPTNTQSFATEQLGSDPLTVWAKLSGSPVAFTLSTPIAL